MTSRSEAEIRDWCADYLARTLELPPAAIAPEIKFARLGLDSARAAHFVLELEDWLNTELDLEMIGDHPTLAELASYLASRMRAERAS